MVHRLAGYALCLFLVMGGLMLSQPGWLRDLGLDFWALADEMDRFARVAHTTGQLDAKRTMARDRSRALRKIVDDLIDDHLTLREAAGRVRPLLTQISSEIDDFFLEFPGSTAELRLYNALISWIRVSPRGKSAEAAASLARLEQELKTMPASVQGPDSL
jgi:hypothetical protein